MTSNIYYLHKPPLEIAHFIRIGSREHRLAERLLSAGKLRAQRYVIEAGNFPRQHDLIQTLRDEHAEIILDTKAAELSVPNQISSTAKYAPWASDSRPLEPDDFDPKSNRSVIQLMAHHAIENHVNAVMAPTHLLIGDEFTKWLETDFRSCIALRESLDKFGGSHISIDYPLIISYAQLRDATVRLRLIEQLRSLPYNYLWLRISGFGTDATGTGIEKYIRATLDFHSLDKPVIADHLSGLAALAASSFGATSGFAHGLNSKERFDGASWIKPPINATSTTGRDNSKMIYFSALDRRLKVKDANKLFNDAKTAREIFGCADHSCCGSIEFMLNNPEAHYIVQRQQQIKDLTQAPETLRANRFLTEHLEVSYRRTLRATKLKKCDDEIKKKIIYASERLEHIRASLNNLYESIDQPKYAAEAKPRSKEKIVNDHTVRKP